MVISVISCNVHGLVVLPAILSIVQRIRGEINYNETNSKPTTKRAVNERLKKIRERMTKAAEMKKSNGHQPDLKMDRPAIPESYAVP